MKQKDSRFKYKEGTDYIRLGNTVDNRTDYEIVRNALIRLISLLDPNVGIVIAGKDHSFSTDCLPIGKVMRGKTFWMGLNFTDSTILAFFSGGIDNCTVSPRMSGTYNPSYDEVLRISQIVELLGLRDFQDSKDINVITAI